MAYAWLYHYFTVGDVTINDGTVGFQGVEISHE